MIICGANDNAFRERLLREPDLILRRACSAGHAAEETRPRGNLIEIIN